MLKGEPLKCSHQRNNDNSHRIGDLRDTNRTKWQFISRRIPTSLRSIAKRCMHWQDNHRNTTDAKGPGAAGPDRMEKKEGSRGSTVPPTSELIVLDDDDESPVFAASSNNEDTCKEQVLLVLDDICPSHLDKLAKEHAYNAQLVLTAIMDQQEKGEEYPRRSNPLKRKWEGDSDDGSDAEAKDKHTAALQVRIDDPVYEATRSSEGYKNFAVTLISQDFATAPKLAIKKLLAGNGSVLRTYTAMDDARRARNHGDGMMWKDKKTPTPALPKYAAENIADFRRDDLPPAELAALDEFLAARASRDRKNAVLAEETKELANVEQAKSRGEMGECGCCFDDVPLNRMVHCASEKAHSFCRNCLKRQAEATVGYQKYELTCMATEEDCDAGFSIAAKEASLGKKLKMALDRIEQQAMLEMAGLEDLETCPFCPYAMEYPSVEENKEFRCENPGCRRVSCRLCRKPTHVPKSCAEMARDEAHDARHTIEEAMSEALIRKCNKCKCSGACQWVGAAPPRPVNGRKTSQGNTNRVVRTGKHPFIKQDGCNKITCTRCWTVQCYVCRQAVKDYSHFNDARRGKPGKCPLYDASTEERHQDEVRLAEKQTRNKVAQERPDLVIADIP